MLNNFKALLELAKPTERITEPMNWLGINTAFWGIPRQGHLLSVMFASYTDESQQCFISVERLAATMRCSAEAVKKGRKQLVEDGWIQKIGIHENKCAIYILTPKGRKLIEDDNKALDAIHQHNKEVESNRLKAVAEIYNCDISELSLRRNRNKQDEAKTTETANNTPVNTKCDTKVAETTKTAEIPAKTESVEPQQEQQEKSAQKEAAKVENITVSLKDDKAYVNSKKYEEATAEFFSRFPDKIRREWTLEEVIEFFNLQPYNWKFKDFDPHKAYIKNFKGRLITKLEFETKMFTILDTTSLKDNTVVNNTPAVNGSNGENSVIPMGLVIPDDDNNNLSVEEMNDFLGKIGRNDRGVAV